MQKHYAFLNDENICIAILSTSKEPVGNFVEIDSNDFEFYQYRKYENGQWSEQKYLPPEPPIAPSIEDQILVENQYQTALLEMQMMIGGM